MTFRVSQELHPPTPHATPTVTMAIRVPPALHAATKRRAAKAGMTINAYVVQALMAATAQPKE